MILPSNINMLSSAGGLVLFCTACAGSRASRQRNRWYCCLLCFARLSLNIASRAHGGLVRRSAQSPFPPSLISRSGAHMTPSPSLPAPSPDSHGPDRWKRAARGAMDLRALILDRQVPSSPRVPARLPPGRADTPAKWRLESGIRAARPPSARFFFSKSRRRLAIWQGYLLLAPLRLLTSRGCSVPVNRLPSCIVVRCVADLHWRRLLMCYPSPPTSFSDFNKANYRLGLSEL
ncbi:hypothetical protein AcV5_004016 [Taiwanofungus camphoratus]|nr:hypothetical protein AcV5_004016 [Antrodia cinnamomea]